MSKKKNVKNKKINTVKPTAVKAEYPNLSDYLAFLPGLLMCLMLAIVLILDIVIPGMAEKQYEDFPNLFTVMDYVIAASGLLYLGISAKRKDLHFEKTDILFAAFALLIIISTAVNGVNELTVSGVPYRYIGIFNMLAFMLIYMIVTRSIKREPISNE